MEETIDGGGWNICRFSTEFKEKTKKYNVRNSCQRCGNRFDEFNSYEIS